MLNKTKADLNGMDFTNLDTWKNIDEYAKQRADEVQAIVTGDELIARLQAEGLTQEQALEVREETATAYHEYRASTEQAIADAKMNIEQTLQSAEDTARKAALYSGLFWLISTLLTFVASIMGAKQPQQITVWHHPSLFVSVTFVNCQQAMFLKSVNILADFYVNFYAM